MVGEHPRPLILANRFGLHAAAAIPTLRTRARCLSQTPRCALSFLIATANFLWHHEGQENRSPHARPFFRCRLCCASSRRCLTRGVARSVIRVCCGFLDQRATGACGRTAVAPPNGADQLADLGFVARCAPPPGTRWSWLTTAGRRLRRSAHPVLWTLRRAAGRSAGSLAQPAVRAATRGRTAWQALRRPRRGGRQGPSHDVPGGPAGLERGRRQHPGQHHRADRGRGGDRQPSIWSRSWQPTRPSLPPIWR